MSSIKETAEGFFDACDTGQGWEGSSPFCHGGATFSCQAAALDGVDTVEAYSEWMKGLLTPLPDGQAEIRTLAVNEESQSVTTYAVFRGTHTGEGGPVPPTGKHLETEYVYVMQFDDGKIRDVTKVWNDGFSLNELGWA